MWRQPPHHHGKVGGGKGWRNVTQARQNGGRCVSIGMRPTSTCHA
jgi:hypothetical protein